MTATGNTNLQSDYNVAAAYERGLWAQVKGLHPGQRGHDPMKWNEWLAAADRLNSIARLMKHYAAGQHRRP